MVLRQKFPSVQTRETICVGRCPEKRTFQNNSQTALAFSAPCPHGIFVANSSLTFPRAASTETEPKI